MLLSCPQAQKQFIGASVCVSDASVCLATFQEICPHSSAFLPPVRFLGSKAQHLVLEYPTNMMMVMMMTLTAKRMITIMINDDDNTVEKTL